MARGLPTKLLLPIITTFLPLTSILLRFNKSKTPAGVQGTKASLSWTNLPAFTSVNPSTTYKGWIAFWILLAFKDLGIGIWTNIPSTVSSLFKVFIKPITASSLTVFASLIFLKS